MLSHSQFGQANTSIGYFLSILCREYFLEKVVCTQTDKRSDQIFPGNKTLIVRELFNQFRLHWSSHSRRLKISRHLSQNNFIKGLSTRFDAVIYDCITTKCNKSSIASLFCLIEYLFRWTNGVSRFLSLIVFVTNPVRVNSQSSCWSRLFSTTNRLEIQEFWKIPTCEMMPIHLTVSSHFNSLY